jgi:hypothetical protein
MQREIEARSGVAPQCDTCTAVQDELKCDEVELGAVGALQLSHYSALSHYSTFTKVRCGAGLIIAT